MLSSRPKSVAANAVAKSAVAVTVGADMAAAAKIAFGVGGGGSIPARCSATGKSIPLLLMTVPLTDMSDATLLAAYAQGTQAAAEELARRLLPGAYGQAMRMLSDAAEAEDVAQDAMMRLWRQAPLWRDGEAQVSTWLYRVVSNLCIDRLRRRKRNIALDAVAEPLDDTPSVEATLTIRPAPSRRRCSSVARTKVA